jgi:hypothetical protein
MALTLLEPTLTDEQFILTSGRQLIPAGLVVKAKERGELFCGTNDEDMLVRCGEFINFLTDNAQQAVYIQNYYVECDWAMVQGLGHASRFDHDQKRRMGSQGNMQFHHQQKQASEDRGAHRCQCSPALQGLPIILCTEPSFAVPCEG